MRMLTGSEPSNQAETTPSEALGDALFSKTQQKVLGLLFGKPDQSYFTNEIIRWVGLGKGTVTRELERMRSAGLLIQTAKGNQTHYQANPQCPIFHELAGIVRKTFGVGDAIKAALAALAPHITQGFIYGSIAKGEATANSDIDLMLVGNDLSYSQIMELLAPLEITLARTISPTLYTPQDFAAKLSAGNHFLQRVMQQHRIALWLEESETVMKNSPFVLSRSGDKSSSKDDRKMSKEIKKAETNKAQTDATQTKATQTKGRSR